MKKFIVYLIAFFLITGLTGCDALQRKFMRKKKTVTRPRFYQLKKYTRKPSPELYKQHFAYWQSWQRELIQVLGQNHKKDVRCAEESLGHLKDMQNILIPSKAEEMGALVEKMEGLREIIRGGELSFANKDYVRRALEREERAVRSEFCYSKVKNSLRTTFEDEEHTRLTVASGKEVPFVQKK